MTWMGRNAAPRSRGDAPEVFHFVGPRNQRAQGRPGNQRAQGRPGARCTRGLAGVLQRNMLPTSIQVQRRASGLPCAMALRLIRDRPGDRLSCHHPPSEALASLGVDASTGASDPNDFTVRKDALVFRTIASTAPCPAFATTADAPLVGQDGGSYGVDLPDVASTLFLPRAIDPYLA
jgi:hypothetical protein